MGGWNGSDKKKAWTQVFNVNTQPVKMESAEYDNIIRCLETVNGDPAGWAIQKKNGKWTRKTASSVKMILQDFGHPKAEAEMLMGRAELQPWTIVTKPFQPEYPGDREWNMKAPQYRYQPAPRSDDGESGHPHWDMIMEHLGHDLTVYIQDEQWAKECGIRTGGDYLKAWYAAVLREPKCKLPYLFFFGHQNCGKSLAHEAFELLVTGGCVDAVRALTSQQDFNGELDGAIVCYVEEMKIGTTKGASEKIKQAVTGLTLAIRKMRTDPYMVENLTHWIHLANAMDAVPIFDGDTRITMVYVDRIPADKRGTCA